MEVAPPVLRPAPAQHAGCEGGLVGGRPDDRVDVDEVRIAELPAVRSRRRVVGSGSGRPGRESEVLTGLSIRQFQHGLIADDRHPLPVEGRAVGDDVRGDIAVREAALPEAHVEGEPQGIARLERLFQSEDPIADLLVHEHGFGGPVEDQRARLDLGIQEHVHRIDRHVGPVHEAEAAAQVDRGLFGIDLHPELSALDRRLREIRIAAVAPLVLCLPRLALAGRGVEDVGVVEEEPPEDEDRHQRQSGRRRDPAREPLARLT